MNKKMQDLNELRNKLCNRCHVKKECTYIPSSVEFPSINDFKICDRYEDEKWRKIGQEANSEFIEDINLLRYIISKLPDPYFYSILRIFYLANKIHLWEHGEFIHHGTRYIKIERLGIMPVTHLNILRFISDKSLKYMELFNQFFTLDISNPELIGIEFTLGNRFNNYIEPNQYYMAGSATECIDKVIGKYGNCSVEALKELCFDEIYYLTEHGKEVTDLDMAMVLDSNDEYKLFDYIVNNDYFWYPEKIKTQIKGKKERKWKWC
jgi:hypothetical protein